MSRIIDNEREKMYEILNKEIPSADELAFASAYFNIRGFGLIKDAIKDKPMSFLVGRPQDESISFEEQIVRELEENEDDPEYFNLMVEAVSYFSDAARSIKKINGPFFHGKAYIGASPSLNSVKNGIGIVGSSNFTYAGLKTNSELNVVNTDRELVSDISQWFHGKWDSAMDYKEEFLSFLKNYTVTHTPYEVVAKSLYENYKNDLEQSEKVKIMGLKKFQIVSLLEARRIISSYNGVVIADSTGLGKTRTMIALAHDARQEKKKVLLIAPKSVLKTTWATEMENLDTLIDSINSENVSANPDGFLEKYKRKGVNFILVDEAHYFKSSSSNRYKALRDLIVHNDAQVVLATATPVNNSLMDLYNLISLFAKDDSIQDITGTTLKGYFSNNQKMLIEGKNFEMSEVLERFVVRHSRKFAQAVEPDLSFPQRVIDKDSGNAYKSTIPYDALYSKLEKINFATYDLSIERFSDLRLPSGEAISQFNQKEKKEKLKSLVKTIVILNIFKRLESSVVAFRDTINSIVDYMKKAKAYAEKNGYFLPRAASDDALFDFDEEFPKDIFKNTKYKELKDKCILSRDEKTWFVNSCEKDIKLFEEILNEIPEKDTKIEALVARLNKIMPGIEEPNGMVIFTQYSATAKYLFNAIKEIYERTYLTSGNKCINASGKDSTTTDIVEDFQAHGGIIVSTDVLSEGQNLQNAQYVVNYDFPWNPVVLIQRVGRIDRMGSKHSHVYLLNIMLQNSNKNDEKSLEHFIGLMGKLYGKIIGIKATIGIDSPVLGEDADPKDFGKTQKLIAEGKSDILVELEKELDQFTNDPKDQLMEIIDQKGEEWIKNIPRGIGAFKKFDKNGVFSLFTDGEKFYWRLKMEGGKELISDPGQIILILMEESDKDISGQKIEYSNLVKKLKDLKESVLESISKEKMRRKSSTVIPNLTKQSSEVYNKLAENDEELALKFRQLVNMETMVRSLYESLEDEDFLEKAWEVILKQFSKKSTSPEKEITLKRICWCLLSKE